MKLPRPQCVERISTGQVNDVWRIVCADNSYLFKWLNSHAGLLLDRRDELRLQTALAAQGLAPGIIDTDYQRWVLQHYVEGPTLAQSALSRAQRLDITMQLMATLHQTSVSYQGPTFWQRLDGYFKSAPSHITERIKSLRSRLEIDSTHVCLCHFDLSFDNIVLTERPVALDWEYASLGNPAIDFASTMLINACTVHEQHTCFAEYARLHPNRLQWNDVAIALELMQWVNDIWYQLADD
ncbi:phosphotransferase family enzyme [Idiomarina fontislapidosi]|uniref:Aminoglycoside phosphotransferase domain-containing protein n=1 Tax=Idiomarina fontislapidosi TaxID=263723 RepID=A0A432Y7Y8_9GAMM|nr:phosphotransferase [Idiomarina fontislapidosi]PYE32343.1 phosphotransferase family enzyme [Idiomarina fontislapidosi]RUO57047.1 hypothetical protein CWE25_05060 [Idiomarina fontislapidosi]